MQQHLGATAVHHKPTPKNRIVYRVSLEALQQYFDHYVFAFEPGVDVDAVIGQYEEQAGYFLQYLGAMVSVERFIALRGDELVYVRRVPPGLKPIKTMSRH